MTFIFSKVIPITTVTVIPVSVLSLTLFIALLFLMIQPHFRMEKWHKGQNPEDVECITQYHVSF